VAQQRGPQLEVDNAVTGVGGSSASDKIARLLALLVTREMDTDDAAMKLLGVGFTPREISGLLGVGDNYVHVIKTRRKRALPKKARKTR